MSTFEVVRGPEGDCLLLDGTRIGGPDPGCGGVSWFVFRIEEACDVVPKDELDRLKDENAKLVRVLHELEQEAVHAYRCLQHDCEHFLEGEQHFFKKWWSSDCENAKLRELVRITDTYCANGYCDPDDGCPLLVDGKCQFTDRMRELGMEVE
jgi:hypothetical protein